MPTIDLKGPEATNGRGESQIANPQTAPEACDE